MMAREALAGELRLDAVVEEGTSALLDGVEVPRESTSRIALPSGRAIEAVAGPDGERVRVRGRGGEVEIEVILTERGPVLKMRAVDLELSAAGAVRVDCDRFHVRAASGIVQETGGELALGGRAATITAERGDVAIEANDDVRLRGERVKLNC
ncbi:hypothetical protein A7982_13530 [Minicystis rosea]|nr:hypothetical protein A7982_13530 [Minicystis rosea]